MAKRHTLALARHKFLEGSASSADRFEGLGGWLAEENDDPRHDKLEFSEPPRFAVPEFITGRFAISLPISPGPAMKHVGRIWPGASGSFGVDAVAELPEVLVEERAPGSPEASVCAYPVNAGFPHAALRRGLSHQYNARRASSVVQAARNDTRDDIVALPTCVDAFIDLLELSV